MSNLPAMPSSPKRRRAPFFVWLLVALGCLFVVAVVLFIPVENWRGKRAWEQCRRELEAKGEDLNWTNYVPAPVPDNENIFKAPHMSEWFVGYGTTSGFKQLLDSQTLTSFLARRSPSSIIGDVIEVPADAKVALSNGSLSLRYDDPVLSLYTNGTTGVPGAVPTIEFDETPLLKGIDLLAREAKLNYELSPTVNLGGRHQPEPIISCKWTNTSAKQGFFSLLNLYSFWWNEDPKTGVLLISRHASNQKHAYMDSQARVEIKKAILAGGNDTAGQSLTGPEGLTFVPEKQITFNRAHIIVRTTKPIQISEVREFFTNLAVGETNMMTVDVVSNGQSFLILARSPCSAADYLAWSDQFEPEFNAVREVLKRPHARRDGNYEPAFLAPVPNFVAVRALDRTLAQRAQCYLLLGQPENALRELTLIYEARSLADGEPGTKYTSLVSAMINAAVMSIYTGVVADGLRLHAWQNSQLRALEKQLNDMNITAQTANSLRCERAEAESTIDMLFRRSTAETIQEWSNAVTHLSAPFLPMKGWLYENKVTLARLDQKGIDSIDLTNDVIRMDLVDDFTHDYKQIEARPGPYSFVAAMITADFSKALRIAVARQTAIDQARIACAVERYRLSQGKIPEALDALTPQFIGKIPHDIMNGQPLKYRRVNDDRFLLYSVGWNQKDDGGVASTNIEQGDWVWPPAR